VDRDRLEQEAVRLLGKGQPDRALEKYITILRANPRERRIRQKVADLYLQTGQKSQAEKHYREVVKQMIKAGQQRGAINILKQLVKIKPDDSLLKGELADCLLEEGFENEAIKCYTECMEKLGRASPDEAIEFCDKLIKLKPGDFSLRIQRAEYIEKANWSEAAAAEWHALSDESRRLGRPGEATRFLEFSIKQRGENVVTLVKAARGQLEQGDVKRALQHLQHAHQKPGPKGEIFALLAACFQALGQAPKAQKLWLQASKALQEEGRETERVEALKSAIACGAEDDSTREAYEAAQQAAARLELRLHRQTWAEPKDETDGVPSVEADTYWKYGFGERALSILVELEEPARSSVAVRVRVAELRAEMGDVGAALVEIRQIQPPDEDASEAIWTRIGVLSGEEDDDELIDDEEDDELVDEDEDDLIDEDEDDLIDEDEEDLIEEDEDLLDEEVDSAEDDLIEDDEEELTDPGIRSGPMLEVEDDPLDFGSDFGASSLGTGGTDFGSIFGNDEEPSQEATSPSQAMGSEGLADVRAWLAVGDVEKATAALEGKQGLEADVWRAVALRSEGKNKEAFSSLRDALDEALERDAFLPEAQLELARLAVRIGKERVAERYLRQVTSQFGGFQAREVAALRRAIELLRSE
jgi:tetratricopeptide (TPR) repeat protein